MGCIVVSMEAQNGSTAAIRESTDAVVNELNSENMFEPRARVWGTWNKNCIAIEDEFGSWEVGELRRKGYRLKMRSGDSVVFQRD